MDFSSRRKQLNLTLKEIADFVGVSEATVSRWESGNIANMRRDKIAALAKILRVAPIDIVIGIEDKFDSDTYNETQLTEKVKGINVGDYIKQLRLSHGYSQEQLGKLVGVQRAAVQKWESGKVLNLKRETIKKLSKIFGVSPSSFIVSDKFEAELSIYLDELRNRPEMRMLFSVSAGATKTEIEQAVRIIEILKNNKTNE